MNARRVKIIAQLMVLVKTLLVATLVPALMDIRMKEWDIYALVSVVKLQFM